MDVTQKNKRDGTEVTERSKSVINVIIKVVKNLEKVNNSFLLIHMLSTRYWLLTGPTSVLLHVAARLEGWVGCLRCLLRAPPGGTTAAAASTPGCSALVHSCRI